MILLPSDIEKSSAKASKTAFIYLLFSLLCALFGAVYEHFSHQVYSYAMLYAFLYPLAGGSLVFHALSLWRPKRMPCSLSRRLYHCGIATLTAGSLVSGILEIYGTTNALTVCYPILGVSLLGAAILSYFFLQTEKAA